MTALVNRDPGVRMFDSKPDDVSTRPRSQRLSRLDGWAERLLRGNLRRRAVEAWQAHGRRLQLANSAFRWSKHPGELAGRDVCLLASFAPSSQPNEHLLVQARAWQAAGFVVVLVVSVDGDPRAIELPLPASLDGVMVRENCGYDFGSWSVALRNLPDIRRASLVALGNDSVYGPLGDLAPLVARVRASRADIVGMTDSHEHQRHVQSYLVFYKPAALTSAIFWSFWKNRRADDRARVIKECELDLMNVFSRVGRGVDVLFAARPDTPSNPTLGASWRSLVDAGFPFVKVALLRDNPRGVDLSNWADCMASRGFDPDVVRRHLGPDHPLSHDAQRVEH